LLSFPSVLGGIRIWEFWFFTHLISHIHSHAGAMGASYSCSTIGIMEREKIIILIYFSILFLIILMLFYFFYKNQLFFKLYLLLFKLYLLLLLFLPLLLDHLLFLLIIYLYHRHLKLFLIN